MRGTYTFTTLDDGTKLAVEFDNETYTEKGGRGVIHTGHLRITGRNYVDTDELGRLMGQDIFGHTVVGVDRFCTTIQGNGASIGLLLRPPT